MKLVEFAKQRGVARDTITQYIRRHPELFDGHTEVKGKLLFLDAEAERLLNEKYPLYSPIELVEDVEIIKELSETRKALAQAERHVAELYKRFSDQTAAIAQAEAVKMLLEDKEEQLQDSKKQIHDYKQEIQELSDQLRIEQSKTWWDKIRGR